MSVEAATFIADLQPVNPPATDPRSQGDDHLRLIKQVLQNTFAGASRQWQVPSTVALSTSASVTKANGESTLYVSTGSGAVTLTMPSLVAGDAGWKVRVIKTSSDANPIFIAPFTGTINSGGIAGLAKARRCIPGIQSTVIWDGSAWFVTRVHALPIGSCIEYHGSVLPAGYEWPNGQTLSSAANYPEYNSAMGGLTTRDKRGYVGICMDNLGGAAAGRLPGGQISGSTPFATGGVDTVTLSAAQVPAHQHNVYVKFNEPSHSHGLSGGNLVNFGIGGALQGGGTYAVGGTTTDTRTIGITCTIGSVPGVANDNLTTSFGGGGLHSNLQPSIMVNQILVVE